MTMSVSAGFDLGGTQIKYGLVDDAGTILFKGKTPTPPTIRELMTLIGSQWEDLKKRAPGRIAAAGFGIPGIYNLKKKKILQSPNYADLDNFDLYPAIAERIDAPFLVENDANVAAFGEWKYGAGRGVSSLVFLTIGTGIGGGIVLGDKLWQGSCGYAAEIGHVVVNPSGELCKCGIRGCLETEASAPAIVRKYQALAGSGAAVTTEDIYYRAKEGEAAAREAFARAGYFLGIGLGMLINLLNPEKILLGGGVMTTGEFLLRPAVEEARKRSYPATFACCDIERASLGNDAGLIGAAAWGRENLSAGETAE
ncbi:MAG: ROK family protein [Candidatus Aminicenantes bacterium]|nr:ROK family protein [Candidatus Aminicenantes bacterium]